MHAIHCRHSRNYGLELRSGILPHFHHALLAVCSRRCVYTSDHQRRSVPHYSSAARQADAPSGENSYCRVMGSVALRIPTVCGRLEDSGDWGASTAMHSGIQWIAGGPGLHGSACCRCVFCAIRCDVIFLSVYSQHGSTQCAAHPQSHQRRQCCY